MTKIVRCPVRAIAAELRRVVAHTACYITPQTHDADDRYLDVRLQVHEDGCWSLHTGDASYDQDHRGAWGADSVAVGPRGGVRFDSMAMARDLWNQAVDMAVDGFGDGSIALAYSLTRAQRDLRRSQDELCAAEGRRLLDAIWERLPTIVGSNK